MLTSSLFINITIVLIPFTIFLVSLIYLLKTYFLRREHLTKAATIVFIVVFLTVIVKILLSLGFQYYAWSQNGLSKFLLPPHQSIGYFAGYGWQHFIMSPVIGLAVSFILVLYFWILNKIFKRQYLDFEDMLILVSGAMIVGWPNLIAYLAIAFILTILRIFYLFYIYPHTQFIINKYFYKQTDLSVGVKREFQRVPLTGALIIAAFITLLIGEKLVEILQLGFLKV